MYLDYCCIIIVDQLPSFGAEFMWEFTVEVVEYAACVIHKWWSHLGSNWINLLLVDRLSLERLIPSFRAMELRKCWFPRFLLQLLLVITLRDSNRASISWEYFSLVLLILLLPLTRPVCPENTYITALIFEIWSIYYLIL